MKNLALKLTFLILLPFGVMSYYFQPFIDKKLSHSNLSNYKEWEDIFHSRINADVIIQGSSRAFRHFSPQIIDSALLVNSYNLGLDGYSFEMQYYRFLIYMKHNVPPKYIIQNVDESTLTKREVLYMPEQFIPYLQDPDIKTAVLHYKGFDNEDFYLPFLKYTHTAETKELMVESCFTNPPAPSQKYKGFRAENIVWDKSFSIFQKNNPEGYRIDLNPETITLFEKYLKFCRQEHIKIIFVYAPEYTKAQKMLVNRDSISRLFSAYATMYNIPFLNYSSNPMCADTNNFYNSQHMNIRGVQVFNVQLVGDLKKIVTLPLPSGLQQVAATQHALNANSAESDQ